MTEPQEYIITELQLRNLLIYVYRDAEPDQDDDIHNVVKCIRSHPAKESSDKVLKELERWIDEELTPLSKKPTMNNTEVTFRRVRDKIVELRTKEREQR